VASLLLLALAAATIGCDDRPTASTVEPPRTVDETYRPAIADPLFPDGAGPTVCFDEAHHNFHTADGTYRPFVDVLRRDGFPVLPVRDPISPDRLHDCRVFVIADAQPPAAAGDPPTFDRREVESLNAWVRDGGALFLITDHRPDPGAIQELAASFGIEFSDGYVLNGAPAGPERPMLFVVEDGTLTGDPLLAASGDEDGLSQVATFTGAAFRAGEGFRPLLVFGPGRESWTPRRYWTFTDETPRVDVSGWYQGGVRTYGSGRLAVFGEAAMFTAQAFDGGRVRAGMNADESVDNLRLLRRLMRWLAGPAGVE
jgi:hypothetical protein